MKGWVYTGWGYAIEYTGPCWFTIFSIYYSSAHYYFVE